MLNRAWLTEKICVLLTLYMHGKIKLVIIWWQVSIERRNFAVDGLYHLKCSQYQKLWAVLSLIILWNYTAESISVTCVVGYLGGHVRVNQETSFIRPAPCHIPWSVSTSTQHQQWQTKLLGEVDTLSGRRWGSEQIQVTNCRSEPILANLQYSQYYTESTFVQSSLT